MLKITFVAMQLIGIIAATLVYAESLPATGPVPVVATAVVEIAATPLRLTLTPTNNPAEECLAEALYWEGRNQTDVGMIAIGYTILNRVKSPNFPDTICEVVHQGPLDGSAISRNKCQFSYFCDGNADAFPVDTTMAEVVAAERAEDIAPLIMAEVVDNNVNSATYYHANYVNPYWSSVYTKVAQVDSHIFYIHW
jgi:spore germination cell wall hydrolase CwlJ-like protein